MRIPDRPAPRSPRQGAGVVKTTVAVKGSNRRIPKTIVKADAESDGEMDVGTNG